MITEIISTIEDDNQRNELNDFYKQHCNRLLRVALNNLHNYEDAEDVLQETFLIIADNPKIFFDRTSRERLVYVAAIVRNRSSRMFKQKHKVIVDELSEDIPDGSLSMIDKVSGSIFKDELMRFIENLPEARREAIYLKIHFGMTTAEIADTLGISNEVARKRISDAEQLIRKFWEESNNV